MNAIYSAGTLRVYPIKLLLTIWLFILFPGLYRIKGKVESRGKTERRNAIRPGLEASVVGRDRCFTSSPYKHQIVGGCQIFWTRGKVRREQEGKHDGRRRTIRSGSQLGYFFGEGRGPRGAEHMAAAGRQTVHFMAAAFCG